MGVDVASQRILTCPRIVMGSVGNNGVCVEADRFLDNDVPESRLAGNGDKEPQTTHTICYMSAPAIYCCPAAGTMLESYRVVLTMRLSYHSLITGPS